MKPILFLAFSIIAIFANIAPAQEGDKALAWPEITSMQRPFGYWWWLGSAVDKENLTKELTRHRDAGMGGVHIIPIYGAKGAEERYIDYLSPKWMEMLAHVAAETKRLGMNVDMTLGTGWCFGGPNISAEQGTWRTSSKTWALAAGASLKEKIDPKGLVALVAAMGDGKSIDLRDKLEGSALKWSAQGPVTVCALWARPTGQKVKRAAPGGEGPMLNPFSAAVTAHYLERFTRAFADYKGGLPRAIYHDSYEYQGDWAPELLAEFEKRRGYRLQDHWAEFIAGKDDTAARVKGDYRATLSDMMVEGFNPAWIGWAHQRGMLTRNQAHGSPGNLLDLYGAVDIPETEMFNADREVLVSKFASSAAHVMGRKLVASETGTWLAEHFNETLGDVKHLVDDLFVSGVNHVVYHGTIYSPDDAAWPGWLFYASTEMNPRNSIWRDVRTLNDYIGRCQAMLQAGQSDNDILLYWPIHDLWHNAAGTNINMTVHHRDWLIKQPVGELARRLYTKGYQFDYASDRQLALTSSKDGRITTPGGRYGVIVVPKCMHMPVETRAKLYELAEAGATIIFEDQIPQDVPGLGRLEERRAAMALALKLRIEPSQPLGRRFTAARLGKGAVHWGEVEAALAAAGIAREPLLDLPGVSIIRRRDEIGRVCFIANHGEKPIDGWIALAAGQVGSAGIMCPMTGRVGLAATRAGDEGHTQVYLQLPPGQSVFIRTSAKPLAGAMWPYAKPAAEAGAAALAGTWEVEFIEGGPALPGAYKAEALASWTVREDAQAFAGAARYTLRFDAPGEVKSAWRLDLGKVCQSARVKLNGKSLGTLISAPFAVDVPADLLKSAGNVLEVEVTSVSANRIRDLDRRKIQWKIMRDINIVTMNYKPFDASGWPLADCGLLGPVRMWKMEAVRPK